GPHLRQQVLVRGVVVVVDLDAALLLEVGDGLLVDVVRPVVEVEDLLLRRVVQGGGALALAPGRGVAGAGVQGSRRPEDGGHPQGLAPPDAGARPLDEQVQLVAVTVTWHGYRSSLVCGSAPGAGG